jgi:uncharacterized membrane protein
MKKYVLAGLVAFYPTFITYYLLNRYTHFWRNSSAWEQMEILLYCFGLAQAVFLVCLFAPWTELSRKLLGRNHSIVASAVSTAFFGAILAFCLTLLSSFATSREIETSVLYYLPLATYGAIFGILASLLDTRRPDGRSSPDGDPT